ncbi:MAG: FAD-dependent oxidoreductase [Pseudomonadota bacterium]
MVEKVDCVVIGAGFAGLTAATALQAAGRSVAVLEARDRVGGRTAPGTLAGLTIDLGGMWLGPTQTRLAALAERHQMRTYKNWIEGDAVAAFGDGRPAARIPGEDFAAGIPEAEQESLAHVALAFETLGADLDPAAPWTHPRARELDRQTVAMWLEREGATPAVRGLVEAACQSLFCAEAEELSMLFFLFYLVSAGGIDVLLSASDGGAQNFLFEGGLHQLAARLGDGLGNALRLESPVLGVTQRPDGVFARFEQGGGEREIQAERCILATPPGLTASLRFEPDLPHAKRGLLRRQPMGSCIKVWVAYDRPFWREAGLNGLILAHGAEATPFLDVTPPGSGLGVLAGFFDADSATRGAALSAEKRREIVLDELATHLGEQARSPIDFAQKDWTAERYSEGCYGAYMGPGTMTNFGPALREPVGRLHWAGTETAVAWSGYVDGAIESGERAASEVLALLEGDAAKTGEAVADGALAPA